VLFHISWTNVDPDEDSLRRALAVFQSWQPPAGAEFQGFWGTCDTTGGFAIVEAETAEALARAMAPFAPWLEFEATPILPIEVAAQIGGEAIAFRDSVS
jgi:hypothetical protein